MIGLLMAFGHSILAMSGEETLAQVYREVESPKLPNFKKAAFIVFIYSLVLTARHFLSGRDADSRRSPHEGLLGQPDRRAGDVRDRAAAGAGLLLNAFVVVVGFLILAGAVNTAIIGSNGVLNRVAEDGVMPDWFLKPHRRYGTTYRILYADRRAATADDPSQPRRHVRAGRGLCLRRRLELRVQGPGDGRAAIQGPQSPREFKVPLNIRIRGVEMPIGLIMLFLILLFTAVLNLLTKEVATIGGSAFTAVFLVMFMVSERYHERRRGGGHHKHLEQFNQPTAEEISPAGLRLDKPYRKLVAIRSTQNLFMLEKTLAETDPETTDVVVMTAQVEPRTARFGRRPGTGRLRPQLDDGRGGTARRRRASRCSR